MKPPTVRIYGPVLKGSWATLTRGFEQALTAYGGLAGVVPTDAAYDPDESYEGAEADVELVLGPPGGMAMARSIGDHRLVYFMYAPNTIEVPKHIINGILDGCDIILVPSDAAWNTVLQHASHSQLRVVPHGIDPDAFFPMPHSDPDGVFTILHHAGSSFERKGTNELMEAFRTWRHRDKARLLISTPAEQARLIDHDVATWVESRGPSAARAQYHQAHVICQPSRAEGFGLCVFEGRACGRPVVVTDVGGHAAAAEGGGDGESIIDRRFDQRSPLMCELGEDAPLVTPDAIRIVLTKAYERRAQALSWALDTADEFRARWSWTSVTAKWYFTDIAVDLARHARTRRQQDTIGG